MMSRTVVLAWASCIFAVVDAFPAGSGAHFFSQPRLSSLQARNSSVQANVAFNSSTQANVALDPNAMNCQLQLPANALTAEGLATPWLLLPPCSQAVSTQQSFAEAAIIDTNGQISIYHPLVLDQGKTAQAKPVLPTLGDGAKIALFFGFNGDVLTLIDTNGVGADKSMVLQGFDCVNGLPGTPGDTFGQVSFCNVAPFWAAANAAVKNGQLKVPALGTDSLGKQCPSSRSFEIVDQDQSDNLPTQYLLLGDNSTVQFTAANKAKFPTAMEIDNASDETLVAAFIDPAIGCTPMLLPSLDNPGTMVASLAGNELQATYEQQEPIALVPLNDPDTVLTNGGGPSTAKTNAYRVGVNQPLLGTGPRTDEGNGQTYCENLISIQPAFMKSFQTKFTNAMTPDATVGTNLFTFLCNRFLMSVVNLKCQNQNTPVKCTLNGAGVATSCTIGNTGTSTSTTTGKAKNAPTSTRSAGRKPATSTSRGGKAAANANAAANGSAPASTTSIGGNPASSTSSGGKAAGSSNAAANSNAAASSGAPSSNAQAKSSALKSINGQATSSQKTSAAASTSTSSAAASNQGFGAATSSAIGPNSGANSTSSATSRTSQRAMSARAPSSQALGSAPPAASSTTAAVSSAPAASSPSAAASNAPAASSPHPAAPSGGPAPPAPSGGPAPPAPSGGPAPPAPPGGAPPAPAAPSGGPAGPGGPAPPGGH